MNQNLADITMVLDRSGSMESIRTDTIGGFNAFLAEQRACPGAANMTLVQFDDEYEVVYAGTPIKDAPDLTTATFVPRGWTALLDAVGRAIVATGERLAAMPEPERPGKVVFVILTDGAENRSREYTRERVAAMVKEQTDTYGWQFVYLGANQDSFAAAGAIGVKSAANFAATGAGVRGVYDSTSRSVASYRSGGAWQTPSNGAKP